jgi:hypothetical protein
VLAEQAEDADGNRFATGGEMQQPGQLTLVVRPRDYLFELADLGHRLVHGKSILGHP